MVQCLSPATEAGRRGSLTPAEEPASEGADSELGLEESVGIFQGNEIPRGLSVEGHRAIKRRACTLWLEFHSCIYV